MLRNLRIEIVLNCGTSDVPDDSLCKINIFHFRTPLESFQNMFREILTCETLFFHRFDKVI